MDLKDNTSDVSQVPVTPEGMPIPEVITIPETTPEQPHIPTKNTPTSPIKEEVIETVTPVETITNIVDKKEEIVPQHKLETTDNLSTKADEEEEEFIKNVTTAHEHH